MSPPGTPNATAHPPTAVVDDRQWIEGALCRSHVDLFFGTFGERPGARARREAQAKALCALCPVSQPCREAGRRNHESGIWGGESEEERARAGFPPRSIARRAVARARRAGLSNRAPDTEHGPGNEAA